MVHGSQTTRLTTVNYYIAAGFEWDAGQIVNNETFRDGHHKTFFVEEIPNHLKTIPDYLARREAEVQLERFRLDHFPEKPSRNEAVFLDATVEAARLRTAVESQRRNYQVYELSVVDSISSAEANYIWFNYCVRLCKDAVGEFQRTFSSDLSSEFDRVVEAYWNNEPTEPHNETSRLEVLFIGTLEVVQRVSQARRSDSLDDCLNASQEAVA